MASCKTLQFHDPYFADGETEAEKRLSYLICVTQCCRIKLGINFCQGLAHQPVSTGQVKIAFACVRAYCINKTLCVMEIKYLKEVGRKATYKSACFTQHTPASSVWVFEKEED